jgi:hypothetical protein
MTILFSGVTSLPLTTTSRPSLGGENKFKMANDKGDNLLTEIPGCPEKRIVLTILFVFIL